MPAQVQPAEAYNPPMRMPELRLHIDENTLEDRVSQFFSLVRLSLWRAFQHDAFAVAKAAAYSAILTFFPALLVVGSVLAASRRTATALRELSYAIGRILPV